MTSIKIESLSEIGDEEIEERTQPEQHDRFHRRLSKYRIHQSDCQMKNDHISREVTEQESAHIEKLQKLKSVQGKEKRRIIKRKTKIVQQVPQPTVPMDQNDLADLNYKEMESLLSPDQQPSLIPEPQPPPSNYTYVPNGFQYFYDFHQNYQQSHQYNNNINPYL